MKNGKWQNCSDIRVATRASAGLNKCLPFCGFLVIVSGFCMQNSYTGSLLILDKPP